MIISFSGASSAGKTSVIKKIKKDPLFRRYGLSINIKNEDDFFLIKFSKIILPTKYFKEYKKSWLYRDKIKNRFFWILVYLFYAPAIAIEYLILYIYYELIFRKKILISDRYSYDYLVTIKFNLGIDNLFNRFFLNLVPRPTLPFILDSNIETLLSRNKNNFRGAITSDRLFTKSVINYYRLLSRKKLMIVIKNNSNFNTTLKKIRRIIRLFVFFKINRRIAFCGMDGTGKTSLVKEITLFLKKYGLETKSFHFYNDLILLKILKKLGFKCDRLEKIKNFFFNQKKIKRNHKIKRPFWWALIYSFDSLIQYYFYELMNLKNVIIYDRFFPDYLVSFNYLKVKYISFFKKIFPNLKYTYLLLGDPKIIYHRKPESSLTHYKELSLLYLKLAKDGCFKIISVNKKNELEVFNEFLRFIYEGLF